MEAIPFGNITGEIFPVYKFIDEGPCGKRVSSRRERNSLAVEDRATTVELLYIYNTHVQERCAFRAVNIL